MGSVRTALVTSVSRMRRQRAYPLDTLSMVMIVMAVLFTTYLATFVDVNLEMAVKSMIILMLGISGLVLKHVYAGGTQVDFTFDKREQEVIMQYFTLGFIGILACKIVIFHVPLGGVEPIVRDFVTRKLFYFSVAVSEELFFRYFLLTLMFMWTGYFFLSLSASSLTFTVYHNVVYGMRPELMILVFACGMILGLIYLLSRRVSVPMAVHCLVNLLAA